MNVQEAIDRLEIQQQLANYANGIDSGDWDLYRAVFTEDAQIDYTRSVPLRGTPAEISAALEPSFAAIPFAQHYITNLSFAFTGDRCVVKAYFYQPILMNAEAGAGHWYGHYVHDFVRTPDGWKSERLVEHPGHIIDPRQALAGT